MKNQNIEKVFISNRQRKISLNLKRIEEDSLRALRILGLKSAELSILLVSPERMRSLNLSYRGIDRPTDVLSFGVTSPSEYRRATRKSDLKSLIPYILGDIVINPSLAKAQAKEHGITFKEEIRWLIVHGLLHLIGYEHEKKYEETRMRKKERELLERLG